MRYALRPIPTRIASETTEITDEASDLRERAATLKHDLGKYVAWQSANFDEEAWTGPMTDALTDALQADILQTRSRDGQAQAAWEVWAMHTQDLPRPLALAELRAVEAAVQVLRDHAAPLRDRDVQALAAARPVLRDAQQQIRAALQQLHRRLLRGA